MEDKQLELEEKLEEEREEERTRPENIFYEYVKKLLKEEGRSIKWLANKIGLDYRGFHGKKDRQFSLIQAVKIAVILDIDLNILKKLYKDKL